MAVNWPRVPALDSPDALDGPLPESWRLDKIENLYELLPIGKRFDQKSSSPQGRVPVIDQSEAGVIGWHNEEPGVKASESRPVVTFANHTCEMRWMQQSFSVIQNVFPLIGRSGVCDTRFLYYGTKGRVHLEEYKGHFPDYRRKWIPVPPIPEQRAIAHILGTLDDKIELNRRMSETLEAMARALFKSWFVDFDPVRAKMEGRDPGLPQPLADLFPARLVDSELGEIPEGWLIGVLDDLSAAVLGGDWGVDEPSPEHSQRTRCIRGADIPDLQAGGVGRMPVRYLKPSSLEKRRLSHGDLVIEISGGSPTQSTGRPVLVLDRLLRRLDAPLVCSNFCRLLKPKKPAHSKFVYLWLRSMYSADEFLQFENGTTGIKNFAFTLFSSKYKLCIPSDNALAAFNEQVSPAFARQQSAATEADTLAALRDALLPKLISGELRVADAERIIEVNA